MGPECPHCRLGMRQAGPTNVRALVYFGTFAVLAAGIGGYGLEGSNRERDASRSNPRRGHPPRPRIRDRGCDRHIVTLSRRIPPRQYDTRRSRTSNRPLNAATPAQWLALVETATALDVEPATLWLRREQSQNRSIRRAQRVSRREAVGTFTSPVHRPSGSLRHVHGASNPPATQWPPRQPESTRSWRRPTWHAVRSTIGSCFRAARRRIYTAGTRRRRA